MALGTQRRRLMAALHRITSVDLIFGRRRSHDGSDTNPVMAVSLLERVEEDTVFEPTEVHDQGEELRPIEPVVAPLLSVPDSVERFVTWAAPGHFYSPVPDLEEVESAAERLFAQRQLLPGVNLREAGQLALFRVLAGLAREAPIPASPGPTARYGTDNQNYGIGDASILQAMLRHLRPKRYLEVGSGWSTALALDTSERFLNGSMSVTAIEPYPELLQNCLRVGDPVEVLAQPVQSVALSRFVELEANDVLFIDSSHVLKVASDVHFLFTTVLPLLAPGVYVHIHDMFWPFEYLRHWIEEGRAWNECYLVHAFLLFNDSYEIVLFNHWLAECHREVIATELPKMLADTGGALWLRRTR